VVGDENDVNVAEPEPEPEPWPSLGTKGLSSPHAAAVSPRPTAIARPSKLERNFIGSPWACLDDHVECIEPT